MDSRPEIYRLTLIERANNNYVILLIEPLFDWDFLHTGPDSFNYGISIRYDSSMVPKPFDEHRGKSLLLVRKYNVASLYDGEYIIYGFLIDDSLTPSRFLHKFLKRCEDEK
jgi:hypothetical protein